MDGLDLIYLDHAATTPVREEVVELVAATLRDNFGNPSSLHGCGQRARRAVDEGRDRLAEVLGCAAREVVFVSSGSEADNLAIRGALDRWSTRGRHLVTSAIEHGAVLSTAESLAELGRADVTVVGCDGRGVVAPEAIAAAVRDETVLVSLMLVNNEVGTVQDVQRTAALVHARNPHTLVHCDAVQALGKMPVRPGDLGLDLLSASAHKLYGPKGVGILWIRHGVVLEAQVTGGGHERGRRSSTENVAGIAGFGLAATLAEAEREAVAVRLDRLAARLRDLVCAGAPGVVVTGDGATRAPGFASFAVEGVRTEVLLTALDAAGVCASGGSACSSGATLPSHVLLAMGLPYERAAGALRCTLGRATTEAQVDAAAAAICAAIARARSGAPAAAHAG